MKDKILNHEDNDKIKCTRDTLSLLKIAKQLMYSKGSQDLQTVHNQLVATINLFTLRKKNILINSKNKTTMMMMSQLKLKKTKKTRNPLEPM